MNDALKRSVDSLQKIYAVIIALAITETFKTAFNNTAMDTLVSDIIAQAPLLVAFFSVVVPFYHGMNRHLDVCYIYNENLHSQGALLFDFIIFCFESALLFLFSKYINDGLTGYKILA